MMARAPKKRKPKVWNIPPGRMMAMEMLDIHGIDYGELTPEQHARLEKRMAKVLSEDDEEPKDGEEEKPE
jgi:hypothetical protein